MMASQAGMENGHFNAHDYRQLAESIDKNVAAIVKNCKLSEDADMAFHDAVLVDLTKGARLMRTSTTIEAQQTGASSVWQALRNYGKSFQHPGWRLGVIKDH